MTSVWFGIGFMFFDQATQGLCSQSEPVRQTESWTVKKVESYPANNEYRYKRPGSDTHLITIF